MIEKQHHVVARYLAVWRVVGWFGKSSTIYINKLNDDRDLRCDFRQKLITNLAGTSKPMTRTSHAQRAASIRFLLHSLSQKLITS